MNKLEKVVEEIMNCEVCRSTGIGVAVPGEGSPQAKVMFVGEAPGKQEAQTGRPFIGRSGQLLRRTIDSIGLKQEEVYITSPVKYLPTTGTPLPEVVAHGSIHLQKQIEAIQPKVIVLLGRVAAEAVFKRKAAVMKDHGTVRFSEEEPNWRYFLTIHPAAAVRFQKFKELFEQDFKKLQTFLNDQHILSK